MDENEKNYHERQLKETANSAGLVGFLFGLLFGVAIFRVVQESWDSGIAALSVIFLFLIIFIYKVVKN